MNAVRIVSCAWMTFAAAAASGAPAPSAGTEVCVTAAAREEAALWGARLPQLAAAGRIRLVRAREDEAFPHHTISRYDQLVNGVPVWGPQLVQHTDEDGRTIAVFGTFVEDLRRPRVHARRDAAQLGGAGAARGGRPTSRSPT